MGSNCKAANIILAIKSRMRWPGHVTPVGDKGRSEGMRPFARPKLRLEDNIKMGLQEVY